MGEEDDLLRIDAGAIEHVAEDLDHALGYSARIGVGGQHRITANHLMGRIVDKDSLGEGPADIDTDAIGAGRQGWFGQRRGFS